MAKKEKKEVKERPSSKKYTHYKIEGDKVIRTKKSCPKCGPGVFMAEHKGSKKRSTCGKCGYTEHV
ncbi:MAG: 30S ribosomal protein S27ae [Candidatus Diapherotrites archaeon]|nr:30S ribosomal protein S27ae [Candidatus Diapherotrites archaeon]